jgi:hypothetical protein
MIQCQSRTAVMLLLAAGRGCSALIFTTSNHDLTTTLWDTWLFRGPDGWVLNYLAAQRSTHMWNSVGTALSADGAHFADVGVCIRKEVPDPLLSLHARPIAWPMLLITAWTMLDRCLIAAWPLFGHCFVMHCLATAWPMLRNCLITVTCLDECGANSHHLPVLTNAVPILITYLS